MNKAPQPPLEYFASASPTTLEGLELARLNQIACLRAEIQEALEELVAAEVDARLARRLSTHHALHNVLLLCPAELDAHQAHRPSTPRAPHNPARLCPAEANAPQAHRLSTPRAPHSVRLFCPAELNARQAHRLSTHRARHSVRIFCPADPASTLPQAPRSFQLVSFSPIKLPHPPFPVAHAA